MATPFEDMTIGVLMAVNEKSTGYEMGHVVGVVFVVVLIVLLLLAVVRRICRGSRAR